MSDDASARELIPTAATEFGSRVHEVASQMWSAPTPCTDWSVRDVVNHVTGEHLWAPHLLRGETIEEVGDRYDGDVVGTDPVAAWDAAAAASIAAFAAANEDQTVHLSYADVPASEYAEQMLMDLAVHAWDLAKGAGLDDRLDPAAVEHVAGYVAGFAAGTVDQWRSGGMLGPAVPVDSDDPQDRLIGFLGRRP